MYCKNCGAENSNDAKFCVNCGSTMEQPTAYSSVNQQPTQTPILPKEPDIRAPTTKQKKKLSGAWIAIIVIAAVLFGTCLIGIIVSALSPNNSKAISEKTIASVSTSKQESVDNIEPTSAATTSTTPTTGQETTTQATLKIGDSVTINNITFTLTGAKVTDERNQFDSVTYKNVVVISYTITNNSNTDYAVGMDTEMYANGKKCDSPALDWTVDTVSSGRSIDCVIPFGYDEGPLELEWAPLFSFSGEKAIFSIELQ